MAFNFGTQYDGSGNIIRVGAYGKTTPFLMTNSNLGLYDFWAECLRAIMEDGIVKTSWTNILSKPSTLAGFGITNAVAASDVVTTATANKLLRLNSEAKLPASITGDATTLGTIPITNFPRMSQGIGSSITDFNDLPALFAFIPGYMGAVKNFSIVVSSGTAITNAPYSSGIWGYLSVTGVYNSASSGWIFLRFRDTSNRIYERQWVNGTWGVWHEIAKSSGAIFTGAVRVSNTSPSFDLVKTNASTDNKYWGAVVGDNSIAFRVLNDNYSSATTFMGVYRSGMTIDTVSFPNGNVVIGGIPLLYKSNTQAWPYVPHVGNTGVLDIGKYLDFHDTSADGLDYATRLACAPSGKLGLGGVPSSSIPSQFQVYTGGAGNSGISVHATVTGVRNGYLFGSGTAGYLDFDSTITGGVRLSSFGPLIFGGNTNAIYGESSFTEQMRITVGGFLGLGTNDPLATFHVSRPANPVSILGERNALITSAAPRATGIQLRGGSASNANARLPYGTIISYASDSTAGAEKGGLLFEIGEGNNSVTKMYLDYKGFYPSVNNTDALGLVTNRWASVYSSVYYARTLGTTSMALERAEILNGNQRVGAILFRGGNSSNQIANLDYALASGFCETATAGSEVGGFLVATRNAAGNLLDRLYVNHQGIRPASDNNFSCGQSNFRWSTLFTDHGRFTGLIKLGPNANTATNDTYMLWINRAGSPYMIGLERTSTLSSGAAAAGITFHGGNASSASANIAYGTINAYAQTATAGSEIGAFGIGTYAGGGIATRCYIDVNGIRPGNNNAYLLGASSYRWSESHIQKEYVYDIVSVGTLSPAFNASDYGTLILNGSTGGYLGFTQNNTIIGRISANSNGMYIGNNLDLPINFRRNNIDRCFIDSGAFAPSVDNNFALGGSGLRWSQIFAASATINTSDERSKTDIKDLDLGLDFVNSLRPVEFKYKVRQNELSQVEDGTETVEVEPERTETRVVTPAKYETVIIEPAKYETVVIQSEELDEEGNVITEAVTEERLVKEAVTEEKLVSEEITEEVIIPAVTKEQPKYKEVITPLPGKRPHAGLIAQEVEEVLGERDIGLFTIGEDGSHGLRYTEFIGPLIKAVQELSAKVDQQAAEIAELKNQTA